MDATIPAPAHGWWDDVACAGSDLFMVDQPKEAQVEQMRDLCAGCPVRRDCLLDALRQEERFTIRAGLTTPERKNPVLVARALDGNAEGVIKPKRKKKVQRSWTEEEDAVVAGSAPRDDPINAHQLGRTVAAVAQRRVRLSHREVAA